MIASQAVSLDDASVTGTYPVALCPSTRLQVFASQDAQP